ncbi:phage tail protein [Mesorhizobium sp. BR1-1-3]|uniref:phage tail tube protein n=1 Tax=Mesorhizobium sp. BR1-1-3 TaxID=2876651 RepID=UPI001CD14C90|nr:phage tail tube protein [Mesorhizobium sp. BR1-1-3]MBZ9888126.1 phage tail protein [Mesorhizobium sp. BR1-1-3]
MAYASTGTFSKMVVEVEWVAASGIYSKWCGLTSRGIDRTSNMQTTEVPECDSEDLPSQVERSVQSQEVKISGSGVWSVEAHGNAMDWWYSGQTKSIRVTHMNAAVGDTKYETGNAYLVQLSNSVEKGQKIQAQISIEFDGLPTRTDA